MARQTDRLPHGLPMVAASTALTLAALEIGFRLFGDPSVRAAAASEGFHVLDLAPVFARLPATELREIPGDQLHPNTWGHELAAWAILGLLETERLVR